MRDTDISLAVPEEYRSGALCCRFGISRLLCDVERFAGPEEIMERYGMGYCYEKVCFDNNCGGFMRYACRVRRVPQKRP